MKKRNYTSVVLAALLLPLLVLPSCGQLLTEDAVGVSLQQVGFTINSEQWYSETTDSWSTFGCASDTTCDQVVSSSFCVDGQCRGVCSADQLCEIVTEVALWNPLSLFDGSQDVNALLSRYQIGNVEVYFQIANNTFDSRLPDIVVAVGPSSSFSVEDEASTPLGTIESVKQGEDRDWTLLPLDEEGKASLIEFLADGITSFHLLLGADVVLPAEEELPRGSAVVTVRIEATASP